LTSNGAGTDPKIANELVIQYVVCKTCWATLHCGIWYWSQLGSYTAIHFLHDYSTPTKLMLTQNIQQYQINTT